MVRSIKEHPLYRLVTPRSIALFGASNRIEAMGSNHLFSLLRLGFKGTLYPIHPREERIMGLRAYRSVMDLPEVPDLAILVLPTAVVSGAMEECGKKGIRHAIVVSGGFREVGGEGIGLENELRAVAAKYCIRFLGPNCIGVANPHHLLNTTFFDFDGRPGFIGMASQSGSFVTQMFRHLDSYGLGFSTAISVGNEAETDIVDCMEYLGACPETRVVALYIEGINRGREFVETARAVVSRKPVVAFYAGGSEEGKRAGFSHTGAMSGPDSLYDGIFRQSGVIRASSVTELFDFCWVLGGLPCPEGKRVVIQTHSGGPGAAAADGCGRNGLELPSLSGKTMDRLAPFVPRTGSINNPVDITYPKDPLEYFSEILDALLEEDRADLLLMYFLLPTQLVEQRLRSTGMAEALITEESNRLIEAQCDSVARLVALHGKPLIGYTFRSLQERLIKGLIARGIPVFPDPHRAARAAHALATYASIRERIAGGGSEREPQHCPTPASIQAPVSVTSPGPD